MAITRVQEISSFGNSATASCTYGTATTAGNLLIGVATQHEGSTSTTTLPTNWNYATSDNDGNGDFILIMYYPNAPSTTSVSISWDGNTFRWTMYLAEYSGIVATSPLDQSNTGTNSTTPTSGSITTSYPNSVVIVGFSTVSSQTFSSPTNSFTIVDQQSSGASAYLEYIATSSGTYSTTCSDGGTGANGVIANFIGSSPLSNLWDRLEHGL